MVSLPKMLTARLGCVAALSFACSAATSNSPGFDLPRGITIAERSVVYEIEASSAEGAARAMEDHGPDLHGRRAPAATRQEVEWTYELARQGDQCRIGSIRIKAEITTTLPRWINAREAGAQVEAAWATFEAAVQAHEEGHRQRILLGLHRLRDDIQKIRPRACADVGAEVERRGLEALKRLDAENLDYDRETKGGQTQGVIWPPNRTVYRQTPESSHPASR